MDEKQFLTFSLGEEEYGVEVLKVQEIKGYSAVTPIPNTHAYMRGVMNLRGVIVPVVDLRMKFGLDAAEYTKFTVIIVVVLSGRVTGLIVDNVSDVVNIRQGEIQPTPELSSRVETSFLSGMAQVGDKLVILLDIEKVVGGAERKPGLEPGVSYPSQQLA